MVDKNRKPDFGGWATKHGLVCADGRVIDPDAFAHQDTLTVPLVWMHNHKDAENVLGHAVLTNKPEGVWMDAYFNATAKAVHMKEAVKHRDITRLSIWANALRQAGRHVKHGMIREVSLVLSGANPGAEIIPMTITHGDGDVEELDEAIIHTGTSIYLPGDSLEHEDTNDNPDSGDDAGDGEDATVKEVYDAMSDDQKAAVHYLLSEALLTGEDDGGDPNVQHSDDGKEPDVNQPNHNIFEQGSAPKDDKTYTLAHSDMVAIMDLAKETGSLKQAFTEHCNSIIEHGVEGLEILFPEARALTTTPSFDKRDTTWVDKVFGAAHKSPFSRIKTWTADITYDAARAKGYIKGNLKKEEFFSIAKRITTPQTVYKKQKLDRDDMIDITDFDVAVWIKGEMRIMLMEELARAILLGDGRDVEDEDKINSENIRPIAFDDPYYTHVVELPGTLQTVDVEDAVDAVILNRQFYKGTGPSFFTTETFIARALTKRDAFGQRVYRNVDELAVDLRVKEIIPVEVMDNYPDLLGILVNMDDYNVGADRGGEVNLFDDFDIDYNQFKYLIETRISGALTEPKRAMVIKLVASDADEVEATAPSWDAENFEITVPDVTGVTYRNEAGTDVSNSTITLTAGQVVRINATADTGYFLTAGRHQWSFMRPSA